MTQSLNTLTLQNYQAVSRTKLFPRINHHLRQNLVKVLKCYLQTGTAKAKLITKILVMTLKLDPFTTL